MEEAVVKQGELYLQLQQTFGKRWRRFWAVLSRERLELREAGRAGPGRCLLRLRDCVRLGRPGPGAACPPGTAPLLLETPERSVLLAAEHAQAEQWASLLCQLAFPRSREEPGPARGGAGAALPMEENSLYGSRGSGGPEQDFAVRVRAVPRSQPALPRGRCVLRAGAEALELLQPPRPEPLLRWPYRFLRRFGRDKVTFSFEAGRRCDSGEGNFEFDTRQGNEIFAAIEAAIEAQRGHQGTQRGQQGTQRGHQETQRGQQGTQRGHQETQRGQQGTQRGQQETQRGQQETQRGHQETQRGQQGTQRGHQETQRGHQGTQRGQQETQRGHQETQRGHQETQRGQQETQRGQQDSQRGQQEPQRGQQDSQRGQQDSQRGQQDSQRGQQDSQRGQHDSQRGAAVPGAAGRALPGRPAVPAGAAEPPGLSRAAPSAAPRDPRGPGGTPAEGEYAVPFDTVAKAFLASHLGCPGRGVAEPPGLAGDAGGGRQPPGRPPAPGAEHIYAEPEGLSALSLYDEPAEVRGEAWRLQAAPEEPPALGGPYDPQRDDYAVPGRVFLLRDKEWLGHSDYDNVALRGGKGRDPR